MPELIPEIITGITRGTKARPRSDFKPTEFDQAITTKGYRMWWSRAGMCPCRNNLETDQPDPTCSLCGGDGYFYFLPDEAVRAGARKDAEGNVIEVNDAEDAVQIYVLMTSLTQDTQIFERHGDWVFGTAKATTQPGNHLGYRDRLVAVESEMVWSQVIDFAGGTTIPVKGNRSIAGLRYPMTKINHLRSLVTEYRAGRDFALASDGSITWTTTPPASGTRLSVHGLFHPHWQVVEHVNAYRDTQLAGGSPSLTDQRFQKLPIHAMIKFDFLLTD